MSKKELRKAATKRLSETQKSLTVMVTKCESLGRSFMRFSDDCLKRMNECAKRCQSSEESLEKVISYFVSAWFKSFLAHKDEIMALWKGTIVRDYHVKLHKDHVPHDRGHENSYYKKCKYLTMCSIDGIDHEFRKICDKYGSSDALDRVIDANEANNTTVSEIIQSLDSNADNMRKYLSATSGQYYIKASKVEVRVATRDNKHMGEEMYVQLRPHFDSPRATSTLHLTRAASGWEKEARAEALATVLDDPDDADLGFATSSSSSGGGGGAVERQKRGLSSLVIVDQEDVKSSLQIQRELDRRRVEEERKKKAMEDDTALSVSLDEIKRTFGAQQLQTTFTRLDAEEWGMMGMGGGVYGSGSGSGSGNHYPPNGGSGGYTYPPNGGSGGCYDDDTAWEGGGRDSNGSNKRTRTDGSQISTTPPVSFPPAAVANVNRPFLTSFTGLPAAETRVITARVLIPALHRARVGAQWLDLPVALSFRRDFLSPARALAEVDAMPLQLSVEELLDEVYRRVWSRRLDGQPAPFPLLPHSVKLVTTGKSESNSNSNSNPTQQQQQQELERGALLALPLTTSVVFVLCESNASFLKVSARLADSITTTAATSRVNAKRSDGHVPPLVLLRRLRDWLASSGTDGEECSNENGGSGLGTLQLGYLGQSLTAEQHQKEEEGEEVLGEGRGLQLVLTALERVSSSSSLAARHLPISLLSLDYSEDVSPVLLALALLLSRRVSAKGGAISSVTASRCTAILKQVLHHPRSDGGDDGNDGDDDADTVIVRRLWHQAAAHMKNHPTTNAAAQSPLQELCLRHCSHLAASSSEGGGSDGLKALLEIVLRGGSIPSPSPSPSPSADGMFPVMRHIDISYCLDRRASRAAKQALHVLSALGSALTARYGGSPATNVSSPPLEIAWHGLAAAVSTSTEAQSQSAQQPAPPSVVPRREGESSSSAILDFTRRWASSGVTLLSGGVHAVV